MVGKEEEGKRLFKHPQPSKRVFPRIFHAKDSKRYTELAVVTFLARSRKKCGLRYCGNGVLGRGLADASCDHNDRGVIFKNHETGEHPEKSRNNNFEGSF